MKKLLLFITLVILLSSCNNNPRDVKFRSHSTWYGEFTRTWHNGDYKVVISVDSAFRVGDTVSIDSRLFVLEERVK